MAHLHYHRWKEQFTLGGFSSEESMRDYLFNNPTLIFEEGTLVVPIVEEKCLPTSALDKSYGRADIILCRIVGDTNDTIHNANMLDLSNVELWIVELKKYEASYYNGFRQLFDYMTVAKGNARLQDGIRNEVKRNLTEHRSNLTLAGTDAPLVVCGALVAPSFDLVGRNDEAMGEYGGDWKSLEEKLRKSHRFEEGYTLFDVVDASTQLFTQVWLVKIARFQRGDEVIVYSENALGQRAAGEDRWVAPTALFDEGLIVHDDDFYFKDDRGTSYKDVRCRILKRGGPSASLMARILEVGDATEIPVPYKWAEDHHEYEIEKLPAEETTKRCSIALHRFFNVYDEPEMMKYYYRLGEKNFVRVRDDKVLWDLKEQYRQGLKST